MTPEARALFDRIAREAESESGLWSSALRPPASRELEPVFSPLGRPELALATESIYEGYLLHYGRARIFAPADDDTSVLLGDYLYAHGLVRLAAQGEPLAVADLSELISLCTQLRAEDEPATKDGAAWAATVALMGAGDARLEAARAELRLERSPSALRRLACDVAGEELVEAALAAHDRRVE